MLLSNDIRPLEPTAAVRYILSIIIIIIIIVICAYTVQLYTRRGR